MVAYSPRDVAFSKILYMVPASDGDNVNQDTIAGGSLEGVATEGEGGVLTAAYTSSSNNATGSNTRAEGTYIIDVDNDLTDAQDGSGTGLILSLTVKSDRSLDAFAASNIVNGGKDYKTSDTITVPGEQLGGTTAGGNVTISPATVAGADGSATAASGVSSKARYFIPVNAGLTAEADADAANDSSGTPSPSRGDGIDYGNSAENLAAQRLECQKLIGQKRDSDDTGSVADEQIGFTVFGVQ